MKSSSQHNWRTQVSPFACNCIKRAKLALDNKLNRMQVLYKFIPGRMLRFVVFLYRWFLIKFEEKSSWFSSWKSVLASVARLRYKLFPLNYLFWPKFVNVVFVKIFLLFFQSLAMYFIFYSFWVFFSCSDLRQIYIEQ